MFPETLEIAMMAAKMRIHKIRLGLCNAYLILGKKGSVLVDAGQAGGGSYFFRCLKHLGIRPEKIRLIVVTHVHFDHVGNLKILKERCGCPVAIHAKEASLLSHGAVVFPPGTNWFGKLAASVGRAMAPLLTYSAVTPDIFIEKELSLEPFGVPGKVIATPGHTRGSLSVLLPNGTACVGDLAANHYPGRLGPIIPPFAENVTVLMQSWQDLLNRGVETICPGHGRPFQAECLRNTMQAL